MPQSMGARHVLHLGDEPRLDEASGRAPLM
jgi:hypothetical protein